MRLARPFFVTVFACTSTPPKGQIDAGNPADATDYGEEAACTKMDLLFVIDNSGTMFQEQDSLANNFAMFTALLEQYRNPFGKPVDFRIGITTTGHNQWYEIGDSGIERHWTNGDDGALRGECGESARWIDSSTTDRDGTLKCRANVGDKGPGMEKPLYMLELALTDRIKDGVNAGFVRDDALLGVVFLTDEDDCSRSDNGFKLYAEPRCGTPEMLHPVSQTIDVLDQVKHARKRWAAGVIAGLTDCSSTFGEARQADRMLEFAGLAGDNTVTSSICTGDLATPLLAVLDQFENACADFPPVD